VPECLWDSGGRQTTHNTAHYFEHVGGFVCCCGIPGDSCRSSWKRLVTSLRRRVPQKGL